MHYARTKRGNGAIDYPSRLSDNQKRQSIELCLYYLSKQPNKLRMRPSSWRAIMSFQNLKFEVNQCAAKRHSGLNKTANLETSDLNWCFSYLLEENYNNAVIQRAMHTIMMNTSSAVHRIAIFFCTTNQVYCRLMIKFLTQLSAIHPGARQGWIALSYSDSYYYRDSNNFR